jgi:hypothetical protein
LQSADLVISPTNSANWKLFFHAKRKVKLLQASLGGEPRKSRQSHLNLEKTAVHEPHKKHEQIQTHTVNYTIAREVIR